MRKIFLLLIVAGVVTAVFSGVKADAIDIYTFKKDRVDQTMGGNRGYISGKPADMKPETLHRKRTLIGVDIELPSGRSSASDEESEPATEKEPVQKKAAPAPKKEQVKKTVVVDQEFEEEEYIK